MGGRDQSQMKIKFFFKSLKKVKSVPKTYQKVITMTLTPTMSGNPSNNISNRTERSRIKTSTELMDELGLWWRLCAQYQCLLTNYSSDIVNIDFKPSYFRNSFFDVVLVSDLRSQGGAL